LLIIVCAGFSQGYVRESLVVFGDASLTADNILSNAGLFRLGLVADLIAFLLDAVVAILFYQLMKPVHKTLAMVASAFRLLAHPAIASINLLNHAMAHEVLKSDLLVGFSPEQVSSIALAFMEAHRIGYLIAGAFFGIHCLLLGILIYRSGTIPGVFGFLMIGAALGYVMESFGDFLYPGHEVLLAWVVGLSAAVGEVGLTLYLIIKGLKSTG
tara:strand:- start:998 stop:1636 length:639 start_codon:yes stop_codon:yes gene_type:complete